MKIAAVGTACPEHYYDQETITRYLRDVWREDIVVQARLATLHANSRVAGRHLALPLEAYAGLADFSRCNAAWIDRAVDLGERAARVALERAALEPGDVDSILFATVTGVASPSIDARLVNRMRFRPDVKRLPLFGLGCVAGAAAVSRAVDLVRAEPRGVVLVLTVELCSLTLQREDRSVANLISTGLFGDGASAAVVVGAERDGGGPSVIATRSVFYPDSEDVMGWEVGAHGFRIVLSATVPAVARERLPGDVDSFLADHGVERSAIRSWVCHPGGPKVLQAMQDGLGLPEAELRISWDNLARRGNMSSASVLMILGDTMSKARPPAGSLGVMLAMGPGFCSELLLLRW
jgi:alkylresorcinol/alkylpyrone synthase